jgi:hypothetical protein
MSVPFPSENPAVGCCGRHVTSVLVSTSRSSPRSWKSAIFSTALAIICRASFNFRGAARPDTVAFVAFHLMGFPGAGTGLWRGAHRFDSPLHPSLG